MTEVRAGRGPNTVVGIVEVDRGVSEVGERVVGLRRLCVR